MARRLLAEERVRFCLSSRRHGEDWVRVLHSPSTSSAHYGGLMVCGSVWVCPVCASKISERRRAELEQAIAWAREHDCDVYLATFTVSHTRSDGLGDVLGRFLAAYRAMTGNKAYKCLSDDYGLFGSVRALENTWGLENGWHPHAHTLLFSDGSKVGGLEDRLFLAWSQAAAKQGLAMDRAHGLRLQPTWGDVHAYVSKFGRAWGASDEMTKAHIKHGRGGRFSPFDLLDWAIATGESQPAELFREYAGVFKGRKQLVWSRGLKPLMGIGEKSDEQLAEEIEADAVLLALLDTEQWFAVRHYEQRGQLLEVARSGDASAVLAFVFELVGRHRAEVRARSHLV